MQVGTRWVELTFQLAGPCSASPEDDCGPVRTVFYNPRTRSVRRSQPSTRSIIDLDSARLFVSLCKPLQIPTSPFVPVPDSDATLVGRYLLIQGPFEPYLQRCGSARKIFFLAPGVTTNGNVLINPHGLVWEPTGRSGLWSGTIQGLTFPQLTPFTATEAQNANPGGDPIALDTKRIYLATSNGTLLSAPF
jgi:hypothetical protein